MSAERGSAPPRIARALVALSLPRGVRGEAIQGDLEEEFRGISCAHSPAKARSWYRRQALRVIFGYSLGSFLEPSRRRVARTGPAVTSTSSRFTLLDDARYALRRLRKAPAFTAVAVITIAIAIGANTAMFSVLDAVLLRPLPYPEADRIVQLVQTNPEYRQERRTPYSDFTFNAIDYRVYEAETTSFENMAYTLSYSGQAGTVEGGNGPPERVGAWAVGPEFFDVFGVQPMLGRAFAPDETAPQGEMRWTPVAILSYDFWMRRFGGDPAVLGTEFRFESAPTTIIGVLPEGFEFPNLTYTGSVVSADIDVYVPLYYQAFFQAQLPNRMRQFMVAARLRDGVSMEAANADLARVAAGLQAEHPETHRGWTPVVTPVVDLLGRDYGTTFYALMAVVGFVLLIACANVANLLLAQGATRRSELAVRAAIGGGRGRLMQLLLTESMMLAGLGGLIGIALAQWGTRRLIDVIPTTVPRAADAALNGNVLGFAVLLTALTGLIFGLLPSVRASRLNLVDDLRGGRGESGARGEWRVSRLLVAGQVAVTVILLVAGGVLGKSFLGLSAQPPGYDGANVLRATLQRGAHHRLSGGNPSDTAWLQELWRTEYELQERISSLPGVESVASGPAPLAGRGGSFPIQFTEGNEGPRDGIFTSGLNWISPNYFDFMRIPILRGEGLTPWDGANDWERYWWMTDCAGTRGPYCNALVSETFAERVWPGEDPIGKEFGIYGCCWRVVGVVGDVRYKVVDEWWGTQFNPDMQVFVSYTNGSGVLVRTSVDPLSLAAPIRQILREIDSDAAVEFDTLGQLAYASLVRPRFYFLVFGGFAGVALLMSLVGLYGVIAYSVGRRTKEIGVRIALGAERFNVRRMVVGEGMVPVFVGLVVGVIGAAAVVGILESFLYGTTALDPWVMAGVVTLLASVAVLACWAPARHASGVDPVLALGHD